MDDNRDETFEVVAFPTVVTMTFSFTYPVAF